jgi:hypothetical protein
MNFEAAGKGLGNRILEVRNDCDLQAAPFMTMILTSFANLARSHHPPAAAAAVRISSSLCAAAVPCAWAVGLDSNRPDKLTDNAFSENFNGKPRAKCLDDAKLKGEAWRVDTNEVQPHSSIGYTALRKRANAADRPTRSDAAKPDFSTPASPAFGAGPLPWLVIPF